MLRSAHTPASGPAEMKEPTIRRFASHIRTPCPSSGAALGLDGTKPVDRRHVRVGSGTVTHLGGSFGIRQEKVPTPISPLVRTSRSPRHRLVPQPALASYLKSGRIDTHLSSC